MAGHTLLGDIKWGQMNINLAEYTYSLSVFVIGIRNRFFRNLLGVITINIFEFISSIISSLSWPLVAIFFVYKFSQPISKVIRSMARMKYRDFEINFGRELATIKSNVEKGATESLSKPTPASVIAQGENQQEMKPNEEKSNDEKPFADLLGETTEALSRVKTVDPKVVREVADMARISPMAAIPAAWTHLDSEMLNVIESAGIQISAHEKASAVSKIHVLQESGKITDQDVRLLHDLRKLKDSVSHETVDPDSMSSDGALDYAKVAFGIASKLRELCD